MRIHATYTIVCALQLELLNDTRQLGNSDTRLSLAHTGSDKRRVGTDSSLVNQGQGILRP